MNNAGYVKQIEETYRVPLDEFMKELKERPNFDSSDYIGIPHPFFPEIGENYDIALKRIVIVGKETYSWGAGLKVLLEEYHPGMSLFEKSDSGMGQFKSLEFKNGNGGNGWMGKRPNPGTFWGFVMCIFAGLYGVKAGWKGVWKGIEYDALLDGFAWGNVNSIETAQSKGNAGKSSKGFKSAKALSERKFDKLDFLVKAVKPHAVILLCSDKAFVPSYLDESGFGLKKKDSIPITTKINIDVYQRQSDGLYIFATSHPCARGPKVSRAKKISELLRKYGLFCPLPDVLKNGLQPEAREFLVNACREAHDKYAAIAMVAHELRRQNSRMSARDLVDILNAAGYKTNEGTPFSNYNRGPYRLLRAAYDRYTNRISGYKGDPKNKPTTIADEICLAFPNPAGR